MALTTPVVYNQHCLVLLTAQTKWLVRTNGLNETNHPQEVLIAYAEYFANRKTSFFFQPSRYEVYLPSDRSPEYSFTEEYGVTHRFTKDLWAQIEVESLNPSGTGPNGIANLTCSTAACSSSLPMIGTLKRLRCICPLGSARRSSFRFDTKRIDTEYREQGSTGCAELHVVDGHVNQRSLVVGMTRHTHRYGMLSLPRRSDRLKTSCSSTNDRVGPDSERQVDLPRAWSFDSLSGKDSATPSIRLETTVEKRSR